MQLHCRLESDLRLARRSKSTQRSYLLECRKFLARFPNRAPEDLGEIDVRNYLHHLTEDRKVSAFTHKMVVAALKFLFARTLGRPEEVARIPWPRVQSPLPAILAHAEIIALFRAAKDPTLRSMLLCGYASGLRVSEVCRLRTEDIDSQRGVIVVRSGKGDKDRLTVLPGRLLNALRKYWRDVRPSSQ